MKKRRLLSNLQRDTMSWVLIMLFLVTIGAAALYVVGPRMASTSTLRLGDGIYTANVVDKREGGIVHSYEIREPSGTEAILFLYASDGKWPVEVKRGSGKFDAVWLDNEKKVVHIVKNISSEDSSKTTYIPVKSARYVVGLPFGTADERTIKIGGNATFDSNIAAGGNL